MTDNSEIIDLLTAIVSTIESQDIQAQKAKSELVEQLKVIASKTDTVSTNFPKLIETLSNFDSKIASSFDDIQNVSKQLNSVVQQISVAQKALETVRLQASNLNIEQTTTHIRNADAHARQLKGLGLQMLPPDLCKNYIPKQPFSQIPAIQTCFQFRNSQKIQTQYGELHVIYK